MMLSQSEPALLRRALAPVLALALVLWQAPPALTARMSQQTFVSPDQAVAAIVAAARAGRAASLVRILGRDGKDLVISGDPVADRLGRARFVARFASAHAILPDGDDKATLVIGDERWPFPIPLVRDGTRWRFDTKAGAQEILARRIGRNELSAIEVCRAYVDAQREYASEDRGGAGLREYARKFVSSPGKADGLYWPTAAGEPQSPLGPLVAEARAEGYDGRKHRGKRTPYHGYYYKILSRQGTNAASGAHDYVAHGHMIGGFALVAFPAQYGASGVMTFIVNQDGIVYEKDLGRDSAQLARRMTSYDPDQSWRKP